MKNHKVAAAVSAVALTLGLTGTAVATAAATPAAAPGATGAETTYLVVAPGRDRRTSGSTADRPAAAQTQRP